jgi:hypothetical protein
MFNPLNVRCPLDAYLLHLFFFARPLSCVSQEPGKDSDDAVDGAGSVLSSGALVCLSNCAFCLLRIVTSL